jgi:hypothetical protein
MLKHDWPLGQVPSALYLEPVFASIAAIAASFAVAYCTDAEGDADGDPAACDGGLLLVVGPQPVASSNAKESQNIPSNLELDIFAADYRNEGAHKLGCPFGQPTLPSRAPCWAYRVGRDVVRLIEIACVNAST